MFNFQRLTRSVFVNHVFSALMTFAHLTNNLTKIKELTWKLPDRNIIIGKYFSLIFTFRNLYYFQFTSFKFSRKIIPYKGETLSVAVHSFLAEIFNCMSIILDVAMEGKLGVV